MRAEPLALFLLGLLVLLFISYLGLAVAERGVQEIMALEGSSQALCFNWGEGEVKVIFAGRQYLFPYGSYWKELIERVRETSKRHDRIPSYTFHV